MPRSCAAGFSQLLPIAVQPLPIKLKPIPILAYWHQSKDNDPAHEWFRRLLIETIGATPEFRGR
jgi:DNA-binding transcriptional LysR family regulator